MMNDTTAPQIPTIPLVVHAQYVRDISFESPNAPKSLMPGQPAPITEVQVNMDSEKTTDMRDGAISYEVTMHVTATARRGDEVVFIAELMYAVACSIAKEVPVEHHHPVLMIEVPKLAFPFARQIMAELTQNGGFPPMLLNPVNFDALYREQALAAAKSANEQAA